LAGSVSSSVIKTIPGYRKSNGPVTFFSRYDPRTNQKKTGSWSGWMRNRKKTAGLIRMRSRCGMKER
jgi:hypothetical protein